MSRQRSPLEAALERQIGLVGLPVPAREHRFDPSRRWRFDFAWPDQKLAVEVEGGVYTHGRHTRIGGFEADCEKYCTAAVQGWTVLRVTAKQIASGQAVRWIEQAFSSRSSRVPVERRSNMASRFVEPCGCATCGDVRYPCEQHKSEDGKLQPAVLSEAPEIEKLREAIRGMTARADELKSGRYNEALAERDRAIEAAKVAVEAANNAQGRANALAESWHTKAVNAEARLTSVLRQVLERERHPSDAGMAPAEIVDQARYAAYLIMLRDALGELR